MYQIGIVSNIDYERGEVRVKISERSGMVSPPLKVLSAATKEDKRYFMPAINEQVAFITRANGTEGVVLGAFYSGRDATHADLQAEGASGVVFSDGTRVFFDSGSSELTVDSRGKVTVTADTAISAKVGAVEVSLSTSKVNVKNSATSLKAILDGILDAAIAETHTTPVGPTSPPINVASYIATKALVALLLD